jgi:hypothetical protein
VIALKAQQCEAQISSQQFIEKWPEEIKQEQYIKIEQLVTVVENMLILH